MVLQDHGIVEQGTHEELIALDGLYKRLNDVQEKNAPNWREVREKRQRLQA